MLKFPAIGVWKPGEIQISWVPSSRRIVPEAERIIDQTWQAAIARPEVHLFDGPMCRMESFTAREGEIRLNLSRTSYRVFYGTNMHHPELADAYGHEVMANSVGLSSLLLSSDGFAMMGKRNMKVAYYPGRVHPFAGCLEPGDKVDVFDEILREFREELSLGKSDLDELLCTGIAEDQSLRQPEMIFLARSTKSRIEIESHLDPAEHHGIWSIPATEQEATRALQSGEHFTPVGVAAILLWGRTEFRQDWFDANWSGIC